MKKAAVPVLVTFVTDQPDCKRLIEAGNRLAESAHAVHRVLSIQPTTPVSPYSAERLQALYDLSNELGAEMAILFHNDPVRIAAQYLNEQHAIQAVSGIPGAQSALFIEHVRELAPQIPWTMVDEQDRLLSFPPLKPLSV